MHVFRVENMAFASIHRHFKLGTKFAKNNDVAPDPSRLNWRLTMHAEPSVSHAKTFVSGSLCVCLCVCVWACVSVYLWLGHFCSQRCATVVVELLLPLLQCICLICALQTMRCFIGTCSGTATRMCWHAHTHKHTPSLATLLLDAKSNTHRCTRCRTAGFVFRTYRTLEAPSAVSIWLLTEGIWIPQTFCPTVSGLADREDRIWFLKTYLRNVAGEYWCLFFRCFVFVELPIFLEYFYSPGIAVIFTRSLLCQLMRLNPYVASYRQPHITSVSDSPLRLNFHIILNVVTSTHIDVACVWVGACVWVCVCVRFWISLNVT